jgi:hypothetical protein
MSIIRRLAIIAAVIAAALGMGSMTVGAGAATTVAAASHAQAGTRSASPDFACSAGDTCIFTGDNWNGTYNEETNLYLSSSCSVQAKTWCSFSQYFNGLARPGSLTVNGNSTIYMLDRSANAACSIYDGKVVLNGAYGYFQIGYNVDGGSTPCTEA